MKKLILNFILFSYSTITLALNPGEQAIDFKVSKSKKLSDYKGQYIVLEWFNEGCPYVKKHYSSGNMQATQALYQENPQVKWITIVSSAEGKQGYIDSEEDIGATIKNHSMKIDHLVRDTSGKVGQSYGAKTTPQMFIIDPSFKVAYAGAIDSIASADTSDISKAKNYITSGMSKLMLGEKPNPQKSKPYGCSVKY